ncbi:unnamed protein product [Amoebophrya sp. A120]|nr:unnamed protein product [Amoebophrya sp. A120]|eukprot:GSA120T00025379001.1
MGSSPEDVLRSAKIQSYACPRNQVCALVDARALGYLEGFLQEIAQRNPRSPATNEPAIVVPLRTSPDGNCLVNAVSIAVSGTEAHSGVLREKMAAELTDNGNWYHNKLVIAHGTAEAATKELEQAKQQASSPQAFLGSLHMLALANVLERPVILVASRENMRTLGVGYHGLAGTFLPVRVLEGLQAEQEDPAAKSLLAQKRPVVLAWGSEARDHFVPLMGVGTEISVGFPVPAPLANEGELPDPFSPPQVPQAWIDYLCRSCGEQVYCGCWEAASFTAPPPSINPESKLFHPHQAAAASLGTSVEPPRTLETAVDVLLLLKHAHSENAEYVTLLETLSKMVKNLADFPAEAKYRKINLENAAFQKRCGRFIGSVELFLALGFQYDDQATSLASLTLPKERENGELNRRVAGTLGSMLAQYGKDIMKTTQN